MDIVASIGHILLTAITFLVIFSALIIIHELGHFWMARLGGAKVEEFGFGLPPKIWGKKTSRIIEVEDKNGKKKKMKDEMEWTLNMIPFGGFVRMKGEDSDEGCKDDPMAFCNRPLHWRMIITLGGITMNFIMAFVLLIFVGNIGFNPMVDANLSSHYKFEKYFSDGHLQEWVDKGFYLEKDGGVFVAASFEGTPAANSEIESGDQIVAINGDPIRNAQELYDYQQLMTPGEMAEYTLSRFSPETKSFEEFTIQIAPEIYEGLEDIGIGIYPLDKYYYQTKKVQLPFLETPGFALASSKRYVVLSFDMVKVVISSTLGKMFAGEKPNIPDEVGGPVGIVDATNTLVELGDISKIIQFAAILSLSLAVINVIPFPALDGGRFFFQLLEMLLFLIMWPFKKLLPGKKIPHKIPQKFEMMFHLIGYMILLLFILLVTIQDLEKYTWFTNLQDFLHFW